MGSVLSVVVPIYNVAPYLRHCLNSIANQVHRDLEVLLVDDGSTDDSLRIAAEYAVRDSRFRLISQPNRGLGAARNVGVEHATGEYLMFVDSDDVLPSYSAELLVSSVEQSGSDFAAGNVFRLGPKGVHYSAMHRRVFAETQLRTHVSQRPELLTDRTAWNKVFRREFWDAHQLRFPEGVLYEDTPVMVPAHVLATSVDVIEVPVYYWRAREGGDLSITQRRTEMKGFVDRITGVDQVSRFLANNNQAKVKRWYDASALSGDLNIFLRVLPDADEEFQQVFLDRCNDFLDRVAPGVVDKLHTSLRMQWYLVRRRMLPELLTVILATRDVKAVPVVRRGIKWYHDLPFLDDNRPELPRSLYRAGTPRPATAVHEVVIDKDKLHLRGHAFIQGLRARTPFDGVRMLWLSGPAGRRTVPVVAQPRRCPDANALSNKSSCSYEWSGFSTTFNLRTLQDKNGGWAEGDWTVAIGVASPGRASRGPLRMGKGVSLPKLSAAYLDERTRITPVAVSGVLTLRVERVHVRATAVWFSDDAVEISGELPSGSSVRGTAVQLSRVPGVIWRSYPVNQTGRTFTARIPLADLPADRPASIIGDVGDRWLIELVTDSDLRTVRPILADEALPDACHPLGHREVRVQPTQAGRLELALLPAGPVATGVAWTPAGKLELTGDLPAAFTAAEFTDGTGGRAGFSVVLRIAGQREQRVFPAEVNERRWRVLIDPLAVPTYAGPIELRTGQWSLLYRWATGAPDGGEALEETVEDLPLAAPVLAQLPLCGVAGHRELVLRQGRNERGVLVVGPDLDLDEQGGYGQRGLRERFYPRARREPLREVVLYNSFTGRQYSDSPRAIHEELVARGLPLEHLWVVQDGQVALPANARAVRLKGRDWYEAYATSRYIVTNQHLPHWFQRREGQVVVQTWHGTPLKRIGHDITDVRFADKKYLEKLAVETPNWSILLSPNRFSTPLLRSAFRYEGEILESGYPRNDVLCRGREEVAALVRGRLGVPADKRVVLYAPTWRDDEYYGPGRYKLNLKLDLDLAAARLREDHVLLVRSHPNVADEIQQAGDGFVWDVSAYPDMADLLAVSDILVTDYSSVMFDFANTGRPMLFFTYDLAHYRDKLRGFYFDFEAEAPGPLLHTSDEVIAAIRDVDAVAERYRAAYDAFVKKACDLDDGSATARVVDRMLALGG